ncbi:MAG: lipocalin-like domain-containing protein [Gammaproteobacteria bacterium]
MKAISFFFLLLISSLAWGNLPFHPIQFPRDEAAHYADVPYSVDVLSEWWYYNGTLTSNEGRKFGYYINYCYLQPNIKKMTLRYLGIQITDVDKQKVYGIRKFFSENESSYSTDHLEIHLGKDVLLKKVGNTFFLEGIVLAKNDKLQFSFQLTPSTVRSTPLLINGNGLVDMWENKNSYYYSYTQMMTKGWFVINDERFDLDFKKSLSWMDHQWGDFIVKPGVNQWFWASIQLENGLEINLSKIIDNKTRKQIGGWANVVLPDDKRIYLTDFDGYSYNPRETMRKFPLVYDLLIPSLGLVLNLRALAPEQDKNIIWEAVSEVSGTYKGVPVKGQGYAESTVFY